MTGQVPLPLRPEGAFPLGEVGCLTVDEAGGAVWLWGTLWWSWQAGDQAGRRLAAVQLAKAEVATRRDIAAAFGTSRETLWRWEQTYKERGVAGLAPAKPGPKGAWKLTDDIVERIVALDREGCTQAKIAATVGVSSFSVRQVLRARVPATTEPAATPSDEADGTERELPVVPAPVPRTDER